MNRDGLKWFIGGIASVILLALCAIPLIGGMLFATFGERNIFEREFRVRQFQQRGAPFSDRDNADDESEGPQRETAPNTPNRDSSEFSRNDKHHGGRHYRGHKSHFGHGRYFGFSPLRLIFGLIGGVIRLVGLGLLLLAVIIWLRPRPKGDESANSDDNPPNKGPDDEDDGPELSEEDLKVAMKKLGITKLEVE